MVYSMTGYGRSNSVTHGKEIIVEIKSLNGKQFEITNKLTPYVKPYETEIRKYLTETLKRGSVDVSIQIKQDGAAKPIQINEELAITYYNSIQSIANKLGLEQEPNLLATIMRMPEVVSAGSDAVDADDWLVIEKTMQAAAQQLMHHRNIEGEQLEKYLLDRIDNIAGFLTQVTVFEPKRIDKIKERIQQSLEEWVAAEKIDTNRLEQELIYYIEKIDISEEKQRLKQHLLYFKQLIHQAAEDGVGKKLGFVLQEIGREINTLGSKANDADMQQIVVNMKDELEKAKEQVLNVL